MAEITKKTDLKIAIKSLERSKHRRVRVSAVFDSDAVGKIEGIIDVEDGQG
jgi:hypothetical protein